MMFAALPPAPPAVVVTAPAARTTVAAETHRVRSGDTVSGLALRYGVSQGELRRANGIGANNLIRIGDRLTIPGTSATTSRTSPAASARPKASRNAAPARTSSRATTARAAIVDAARAHGVDPNLALAVGWQESRWRQNAVSHAGARGVMQCMPSTGRWMSEKLGRTLDLSDVRDNATCGVMLLKTLQRSTDREATVLAAYYQGMASVQKNGMYSSTRQYVSSVQEHRDRLAAGRALRD